MTGEGFGVGRALDRRVSTFEKKRILELVKWVVKSTSLRTTTSFGSWRIISVDGEGSVMFCCVRDRGKRPKFGSEEGSRST